MQGTRLRRREAVNDGDPANSALTWAEKNCDLDAASYSAVCYSLQLVKNRLTHMLELDFQVENQPRAAYIGRTALVCVEACVHSVIFLKQQVQA